MVVTTKYRKRDTSMGNHFMTTLPKFAEMMSSGLHCGSRCTVWFECSVVSNAFVSSTLLRFLGLGSVSKTETTNSRHSTTDSNLIVILCSDT